MNHNGDSTEEQTRSQFKQETRSSVENTSTLTLFLSCSCVTYVSPFLSVSLPLTCIQTFSLSLSPHTFLFSPSVPLLFTLPHLFSPSDSFFTHCLFCYSSLRPSWPVLSSLNHFPSSLLTNIIHISLSLSFFLSVHNTLPLPPSILTLSPLANSFHLSHPSLPQLFPVLTDITPSESFFSLSHTCPLPLSTGLS